MAVPKDGEGRLHEKDNKTLYVGKITGCNCTQQQHNILYVSHDCILYAQKARSEEYQKESTEGQGFNACDTYALAAAINDTLITEMEEVGSWPLHVKKQNKTGI